MSIELSMVGLVVEDMARSLQFYRTLGIDVPDPEDGGPYTEVAFGGVRLSWNLRSMMESIMGEWTQPQGQRVGIAFLCEGPDDVDARYHRLVTAGYKGVKAPWDAFWGQRYAIVEDPDGTAVDLFAPLAQS